MDKSITLKIIAFLVFISTVSCNSQQKTRLIVHNLSHEIIDSLYVWDIFSGKTERIYNVKINERIVREYNYDRSKLPPKGEHSLLGLVVFKKDYYYQNDNGLIGFPMSFVEDNYDFYIRDNGVFTITNFNPPTPHPKTEITKFKLYNPNMIYK